MKFSKIGRYEIIEKAGQGSMGVVYKGRDTVIKRIVAIKTIKLQNDSSTSEEYQLIADRFYHEAQIAGRLSHPNITTIYDVGEFEGTHFIVMEYVEGTPLDTVIKKKRPLSLTEKIKIIILSARVLHYAHQRKVIHRDIKPSNIMLLDNLQIKIMDFGISKLSSDESLSKTQPGSVVGTPLYMSPEQLSGESLNRQTDIFSLGVLSYELLSGFKPFYADNLPVLIAKIMNDGPIPLSKVNPLISGKLEKIIFNSLEKNRNNRYQSALEFADSLELDLNKEEMVSTRNIPSIKKYTSKKLIGFLQNNYTFFAGFSENELRSVIKISNKKVFTKGEVIFNENTFGNELYVIIVGEVLITKKKPDGSVELLNRLKVGDSFGEMAIVDETSRFASATSNSHTVLIAVNEVILRNTEPMLCLKLYKNLSSVLSEKIKKIHETRSQEEHNGIDDGSTCTLNANIEKWKLLLKSVFFFKAFNNNELEDLIIISEPKKYAKFQNILTEGDLFDAIYIILKGSVLVEKRIKSKQTKMNIRTIGKGCCFGEAGTLLKESRSATVKADSDVYLLRVTEKQLEKLKPETRATFFRQLAADLSKRLVDSSK